MKTQFDKDLTRNINKVKKGIKGLKSLGLEIVIDKDVETIMGSLVNNIYVVDRFKSGKVILQKHLFTI